MKNNHQKYRLHLLTAFLMLNLLVICGFAAHSLAQDPSDEQIRAGQESVIGNLRPIYPGTFRGDVYAKYEEEYGEPIHYRPHEFEIITEKRSIPPLCCPTNNCTWHEHSPESMCICRTPPQCMYEERRNRMKEMRTWWQEYIANLADINDLGDKTDEEKVGVTLSRSSAGHSSSINDIFKRNWIGSLKSMTRQMSATMMQQAMAIGTFIDARQQLRTQLVLQELTADAHADYRPDTAMCVFGTNVRGLAATDAIAHANAAVMNEVLMQREVLRAQIDNSSLASSFGPAADYQLRYNQFKTTYCNPTDYGGELSDICDVPAPTADSPSRSNMDIDFTHNFDLPYTLDVDFTDSITTPDEEDILALSRNLFGSRLFSPIPQDLINQRQTVNDFTDVRAVHAVRSVSRNSFTKLVGMKAKGNASTQSYLRKIVAALGGQETSGGSVNTILTDAELSELVGSNPSYFAQMEILTAKLYQNPSFYVNLYTSPENVARASVALKAFELMQDRDRYESALRREMFVAMLVEMNLRNEQVDLNNEIFGSISDMVRSPIGR